MSTIMRPLAGGTRVRHDGFGGRWTNERTGQGLAPSRVPFTDYVHPVPLGRGTVDALLQFNGLGRRLALREPYDATREGFTLGEDPRAGSVAKAARKRGVLSWIRRARGWARAYGGAAIVLMVDDGRESHEPIDYGNIQALRGARVLTRWELSPTRYDWDARSYRLGDVELWQVNIGHATLAVHSDRVLVMQGADLPDDVKLRDNGWGASIFDQAWAELRNYGSSLDYMPEFVSLMTQGVFKQKGLAAGVLAGKAQAIAQRYEVLTGGLSVLNALALDKDNEDYTVIARPVAGLKEIFEVLVQALVAAGDMPRVILLGETPGGLHAGADSPEVRAWYDDVTAKQAEFYTEPLSVICDLLMRSRLGPTAGQVVETEVEWLPLYQQTDQEWAALELTRSQRRSSDVAAGIVSAQEARRDPDVQKLYGIDPDAEVPLAGASQLEEGLPDEAELEPVVAADPNAIPDGEQLISAQDAATRLRVSPGTVHRMASLGKFPAWRVGSRWRYAWSLIHKSVMPAPPAEPTVH